MTFRIPWADDTWLSPDKFEQHLPWAVAGVLLLAAFVALPLLAACVLTNVAGVLVELVQWYRHARNERKLVPDPAPYFAHLPSYKDLAWNLAGSVLGVVAMQAFGERLLA